MALIDLLHVVLIAAAGAAAYDLGRRWLASRTQAPEASQLLALSARVDENERAFKATLLDWRTRFNELEQQVQTLPSQVHTKVAGTVAAIGALPSAPNHWR